MENLLSLVLESQPFYDYKDAQSDIKSIIHAINLLYKGPDEMPNGLVGAEIGVFKGDSFLTILQNCPNVTTLHGVDSYKPYADFLKVNYDGSPAYIVDEKQIEYIKLTSYHRQKYSGHKEKIVFHEMDSNEAAKKFENESLDFIFIDTYMTPEQASNDLQTWYSKVKIGGLFAGHDWNSPEIQNEVINFFDNFKTHSNISKYDNTWAWIK